MVIDEYADLLRNGIALPPVVAFYDSTDYWLADGFHRANAHADADLTEIDADVKQGTREDAVWYSCSANKAHGHPRNSEDKRRAVITALQHINFKSQRQVAEHVGVSNRLVSEIQSELLQSNSSTDNNPESRTQGKDGKWRKPASKKRSEAAKTRKCSQCGQPGHNKKSCGKKDNNPTTTVCTEPEETHSPEEEAEPDYDSVAALALQLVAAAESLSIEQQDSIVRLVSSRIGSRKAA